MTNRAIAVVGGTGKLGAALSRRAKRLLGEGISVVSAFHNVAAHKLATDEDVECDRIARDSWRRPGQFRGNGSNDVRSHFHQQDLYS